jgi:hypothetical protein
MAGQFHRRALCQPLLHAQLRWISSCAAGIEVELLHPFVLMCDGNPPEPLIDVLLACDKEIPLAS